MEKHIKTFFLNFQFNFMILFSSLFSGVILARMFGPEGRGIYASITGFAPVVGGILSWGFINYLSVKAADCDEDDLGGLTKNVVWLAVLLSTLGSLILGLVCFVWQFQKIYSPKMTFVFSCLWLYLNLTTYFISSLLRGRKKWLSFNTVKAIFYPVYSLGLILIWRLNFISISHAIMMLLVASAFGCFLAIYQVRNQWFGRPAAASMIRMLRAAKPYAFSYYSEMGISMNESFLILLVLRPIDIGYFTVAMSCGALLQPVMNSIGQILFVESFRNHQQMVIADGLLSKLKIVGIFSFFLCLALGAVIPYAIPFLYGRSFIPSVRIFWVLMPGIFAASIVRLLDEIFSGRGMPEIGTRNRVYGFFLTVVLCIIGAKVKGPTGYALGYTIASCWRMFHMLRRVKRGEKTRRILMITSNDRNQLKEFFRNLRAVLNLRDE